MENVKVEGIGKPSVVVPGSDENVSVPIATPPAPQNLIEALRRVHVFADLPEDQLTWFAENSEERFLDVGDVMFRKGDPPDWMVVYLEGEVHARREENSFDGTMYIARAGDAASEVSGMLPFSRMTELAATGRAVLPTRLLLFSVRHFPQMMQRMPVLVERLVGIMSDRVRTVTKEDQQQDKLTALGKLSAGLAHELNNPAAAATRAADELLGTLETLRAADLRLCRNNLSAEQRALIAAFEQEAITHTATASPMSALEQADLEDELTEWLDEQGVEDGWTLTTTLVEAGVNPKDLASVLEQMGREAIGDVLTRFAAQLSTAKLVSDIKTSTGRISDLVGAIKEYTYMDQAGMQEVDLRKGLENTLLILKHKLRTKNIIVERDYADAAELPPITAHGSELNQVWTNLIDNAVDAMSEGGKLGVRTKHELDNVLIEIRDNGAGIPAEIQTHIFDPFFTTKPVGAGTGLGLENVARIVRKHHGNIRFESQPGQTSFQVRLPLGGTSRSG